MPPGRPPKRPSDGMNSSSLDGLSGTSSKPKLPRVERGPEDFSKAVQSKLQTYTRTGQACDRCKIRKIRCDAAAEGCSHCTQQNLECYVTDRVTGRTERRGYLQQLEREKNRLLTHIRDLEQLLKEKGVSVGPYQDSQPGYLPGTGGRFDADLLDGTAGVASSSSSSSHPHPHNHNHHKEGAHQPFGGLSTQQNSPPLTSADSSTAFGAYLDVAKENAPCSSFTGTQLTLLGTTIDITSFDSPDMDDPPPGAPRSTPLYNKSVQSFYNSVAKVNPPIDAPLPSRDDAVSYSEWFFVMVGGFVPILHKPSYMKLLTRIYDEPNFKPSKTELVIVHMVFAIIYYQFGIRNGEDSEMRSRMNDLSNKHYHWCVDKTWNLASEISLQSIQALVLMAMHCRCFPKPGPVWLTTTLAWNRAIEMNLHRSLQKRDEPINLESEMRKRVWWCLFMLVVVMYGRLGKLMPIRGEDIDVEYPVVIADEYLTENGIVESGQAAECPWAVSSGCFRLAFLFMEMYNKIYVVRTDSRSHVEAVRTMEDKFRAYQRDLPDELKLDKCKPANRVMATYLETAHYEFLLCLRHPSRCVTNDPAFVAESYRICEDASRRLLQLASELARLKSLDTTWYQLAVYVAAVFTLLAARWVRRAEVTLVELAALKEEMKMGLAIINEVITYIGTPDSRVSHQIKSVVDRTIANIEQDMVVYQQQQQQQQQQNSSNASTPYYQSRQIPNRNIKHDEYGASRQGRGQRSATGTPTPGPTKDSMGMHRGGSAGSAMGGGAGGGPYYTNSPMTQMNTAYSQMGYPELASSGVAPSGPPTTSAGTMSGSYIPTGTGDSQQHHQQQQQQQQQQHHQYLYAATAAAQLGHTTPASSPQTATAPNPAAAAAAAAVAAAAMVGYGTPHAAPQGPATASHHPHHPHPHASHSHHHHQHQHQHQHPQQHPQHHPDHHHPHHPHQQHPHHHHPAAAAAAAAAAATGGPATNWMTAVPTSAATPWSEWTNAMVDPVSQDRYSANALLTLGATAGGGPRGPGDGGGGGGGGDMGVGGHPGVPAGQSGGGQWPMLVFHPNVSGA